MINLNQSDKQSISSNHQTFDEGSDNFDQFIPNVEISPIHNFLFTKDE